MKQSHIVPILWAICLCASCSDDSNIKDLGDPTKCQNDTECSGDLKCVDNACIAPGSLGADCQSDDYCQSNRFICHEGKCAIPVAKGGDCTGKHSVCLEPAQCYNGVCSTVIEEDGECMPNSKTDVCSSGLKCIQRKCTKVVEENGECTPGVTNCDTGMTCKNGVCTRIDATSCQSDDNCPESQPTCLPNGVCGTYVDRSQECDDETRICKDGLECSMTCFQISTPDGSCDNDDNIFCPEGYYCSENTCQQVRFDLKRGDSCNADFRYCEKPFVCENGFCNEYVNETEACDEAEHLFCKGDDLICYNGQCTPVSGDCTKSTDCTEKDSYCCVSDTCGAAKGKCVTYDQEVTFDSECKYKTKPGIFEAKVQCRWQPPAGNAFSGYRSVEMHPLVGHFGNAAGIKTTVAFLSMNGRGGNSVLRIINPETCETLETVENARFSNTNYNHYPAAADLDGDGYFEIVARLSTGYWAIVKWDDAQKKHIVKPSSLNTSGPASIFDINGDGKPEVIWKDRVADNELKLITSGNQGSSETPAIGLFKFDDDPNSIGIAAQARNNGIYQFNKEKNVWDKIVGLAGKNHAGYADFGTPGNTAEEFDFNKLDGKPEFVFSGGSKLLIIATPTIDNIIVPQIVMDVSGFSVGGPVTIGDFDNDGLPEIGVASSGVFGVYDPLCKAYNAPQGCADKYILWERWSQDNSSGETGSSLFDFDGDGQPEAVYGDECFVRVYEGNTGRVLFSSKRASGTSIEAPVIADVDDDGSAEILMSSDEGDFYCTTDTRNKVLDGVDPIHEGIRCIDDEDCPMSKNCNQSIGLCTCTSDAECNTQYIKDSTGKSILLEQYVCTDPIDPKVGFKYNTTGNGRTMTVNIGTRPQGWKSGDYKVCRATRKVSTMGQTDVMILKDRLDRWVSSRNVWNQHAYNIINIEDDGKLPSHAAWWGNWIKEKLDGYIHGTTQKRREYNSYRLNSQGIYGAGTVPDITGRFEVGSICGKTYTKHDDLKCTKDAECENNRVCHEGVCADMRYVISGKLCNRGTKPVSTNLPASFFFYDKENDTRGDRICTSYTKTPVGIGKCDKVGCEVTEDVFKSLVGKDVLMITNEDEHGHRSTDECNYNNNNDKITINACAEKIEIVN